MSQDRDDRWVQRFLDQELSGPEAARFAERLLADADLRERVEAERRLRRGFAAARMLDPASVPHGFAAGVLAEVRRLPARQELERLDLASATQRLCLRVLLAAVVLIGLGLAWHVGLLDRSRAGAVRASPDEVRQEMDRLDRMIRESATGRGADRQVTPSRAR